MMVLTNDMLSSSSENDYYYPFGLTMTGISDQALQFGQYNRYRYNGIESDTTFGLDDYEAPLRNLDPQIGRWWQIDPKSSDQTNDMERWSPYASNRDNPIMYKDPKGDCPSCLLGLAIGVAVDYAFQVAENRIEGKDWATSLSDIDGNRLIVAGAAGLATSGVSALYEDAAVTGTAMVLSKAGAQATVAGVGSVLNQTNDALKNNEDINISPVTTASAAIMGPVSEVIGSDELPKIGINNEAVRSTTSTMAVEGNDAVAKKVTSGREMAGTPVALKVSDQTHAQDATGVSSTAPKILPAIVSPTYYVQANQPSTTSSAPYTYQP